MSLAAANNALSYEDLALRIAALVEALTPVGAVVLVVSKGDEDLLRFDGRSGWHFPRAATGQYAGHHPLDGKWAVEHLESLRAAGGAYLVLPSTYYWWFEYYPELELHLRGRYERIGAPDEICRIYRLLDLPAATPRVVPDLAEREQQRRCLPAMRALAENLLPEDEVVLVWSEGDDDLLVLERQAWHFPHDAGGRHVPPDGDGTRQVSQLQTLSRNGVRYLILPAASAWTLGHRPALAAYLERECRRLALRERVCAVYELNNGLGTSTRKTLRSKEAAWQ
jgi:hypothetical protein